MVENTWAEGLRPKFTPLNEVQSKLYLMAVIDESNGDRESESVVDQFLIQVLEKRIEVRKLPIQFSNAAKLAILALVDRPGSLVALLIDCLNAYEGKTVTVSMLSNLYPTGFYDEDTLIKYIDNYLKPKKVKWAEIY